MALEALAEQPYLVLERHKQQEHDLTTQFAELVDGPMLTAFDLYLAGDDLIGEDGRSLEDTTREGLKQAQELIKTHPNLWFEVRRRRLEAEEHNELVEMAKGSGPNTKVVISDFPPELIDAKEDIGGYNVRRKQTMMRVYVRQPNGVLRMYSRSLDGSNRQALEAIYSHLGSTAEPGELLGQRIDVDIDQERQANLEDELREVYDSSLASQVGGEWYAGRQPADYRNTYRFVCCQQDLIRECIRLDDAGILNNDLMYKMAAAMTKRFVGGRGWAGEQVGINSASASELHHEINVAGDEARRLGLSFSACGATLTAESAYEQAGFGNKTNSETNYRFDKKMHCVICQAKPKGGEPKKMCGPCGICRSCDRRLGGKG